MVMTPAGVPEADPESQHPVWLGLLRNPMGTGVSSGDVRPEVLVNEGFREDATCRTRRREIATFRFLETVLGIAFSQVYDYDEF